MTTPGLEHLLGRVSRSLELADVLSELLRAARELAGTERNLVLLCDADGSLVPRSWDGFPAEPSPAPARGWMHPAFTDARTAPGPIPLEPASASGAGVASPLAEVRAGLVAALRLGNRFLGVLLAGAATPRAFTVAERQRLGALADHAAIAVEHAQRYAEATRRSHRLAAVLELGHGLTSHRPCEELLQVIVDEAMRLVGATGAACRLLEGNELTMAASAGTAAEIAVAPPLKAGEGLCGLVVARGAAIRVPDLRGEGGRAAAECAQLARRGLRAYLGVPLLTRDRVVGVLSVSSTECGRFDEDDVRLLAGLADQAAVAVEAAGLVQQLVHAERLAAVGRIVAGVAHELNNPLAVVIGTADLLQREGVDARVAERLRRIGGQAQRAVQIVRSLLGLARKQPASCASVDVNRLIEETLELEVYQLRSAHVAVVRDFAPELPTIMADPNQLQQVFINLLLNAVEAMREARGRGTLTVATHLGVGAERIVVTVSDDGPGVAPRDLGRIFEPFFTTKRDEKGTGLGLSICRQIVENHHGTIRVDSQLGTGATFTLELPIARDAAHRQTEPAPPAVPARPGVRVLLVEDDRVVGDLLAEFLSLDGHQVDRAANGREALDLVRRREYALIVSDVRMPYVDGPALYRELASASPHLARRMLFVTGDVIRPETRRFLEESRLLFLEKPFGIGEFLVAIHGVLDEQTLSTSRRAKTA